MRPATTQRIPADLTPRSLQRRTAIFALGGALFIGLSVAYTNLFADVSIGILAVVQVSLCAVLILISEFTRDTSLRPATLRWFDIALFGTLSLSISLYSASTGSLTSPLFLFVAVAVAARALLLATPIVWSVGTLVVAWLVYPSTMAVAALFDASMAQSWMQGSDLIRFFFSNAAILGFGALGLIVSLNKPTKHQAAFDNSLTEHYDVIRHLGSNSLTDRFVAKQAILGRKCELTVLRRQRARDPDAQQLFTSEMAIAARLNHPNIVEVYASDRLSDGRLLYATEYLDGITFAELLSQSGPQPAARVVHLIAQVCEALSYAHSLGHVHGHLSPKHLVITPRGSDYDFVKVIGFGQCPPPRSEPRSAEIFEGDVHCTPPEVVHGEAPTAKSDLYSLAAIAFNLLTDQPLFGNRSPSKVMMAQVTEQPPTMNSIARSFVPPDVEFVVSRALSKPPEYRFKDIAKFRRNLLKCDAANRWSQIMAKNWWSGVDSHELGEFTPQRTTGDQTMPTRPDKPSGPQLH